MSQGLSDREAGALVGVSHTAIRKARDAGRFTELVDGKPTRAALMAWMETRRAPRGGNPKEVSTPETSPPPPHPPASVDGPKAEIAKTLDGLDLENRFEKRSDAEKHKETYVALLRELEYLETIGQLVPADMVRERVAAMCLKVRNRLLAIPSEQAPAICRLKTPAEVEGALRTLVTAALDEMVVDLKKP